VTIPTMIILCMIINIVEIITLIVTSIVALTIIFVLKSGLLVLF
jgi:hypothetical protein